MSLALLSSQLFSILKIVGGEKLKKVIIASTVLLSAMILFGITTVISDENQPPVASFTYNTVSTSVSNFDASASYDTDGTIVSYEWDFGDGTTDSGVIVTHVYPSPGNYIATLTVTDNAGAEDVEIQSIYCCGSGGA